MTPAEYLDSIKERLLTDAVVTSFHVRRERYTVVDGHIRIRASLVDGSLLEFSEYVERTPDDQLQVTVYSYHWETAEGHLICRWDNTPHFPNLSGFPHHIHDGQSGGVQPGQPMNLFSVLDRIQEMLAANAAIRQ